LKIQVNNFTYRNKKKVLKPMIIYGLKNCDRCRAFLKAHPDFKLVDVSIFPVPENILKEAIENFGEKLINKKSTTWRKLDSKTKEKQPEEIMRLHPKVMKRPLVAFKSGELSLGFKASKG
tara:strand:+ start:137 stop:496 length:360 start_codon:yes stop_codon:yes gene_type:complete